MDLADYDLHVNHNGAPDDADAWIHWATPTYNGGKMDVASCRNSCTEDPHVENICWSDRTAAIGYYSIAVIPMYGSDLSGEEWTLKMYDLDGNLYRTWKGRNRTGGQVVCVDDGVIHWGHMLTPQPILLK